MKISDLRLSIDGLLTCGNCFRNSVPSLVEVTSVPGATALEPSHWEWQCATCQCWNAFPVQTPGTTLIAPISPTKNQNL